MCLQTSHVPWISFPDASLASAFHCMNRQTPHHQASQSCLDCRCQDRRWNWGSKGHRQLQHCPAVPESFHRLKPPSYRCHIPNRANGEGGTEVMDGRHGAAEPKPALPLRSSGRHTACPCSLQPQRHRAFILRQKTKHLFGLKCLSGTFSIFQRHSFDNAIAVKSRFP